MFSLISKKKGVMKPRHILIEILFIESNTKLSEDLFVPKLSSVKKISMILIKYSNYQISR